MIYVHAEKNKLYESRERASDSGLLEMVRKTGKMFNKNARKLMGK